jgi:AcrR family transcriptional regulator
MEKPHGKDAVKEAIIEAAVPLIAERGVENVSFRDIAQAANVNHGLITRHFGSKDELMRMVGLHLAHSMFQDAVDRGDTLKTLWDRGFSEHSVQIKAVTRILMDLDAREMLPYRPSFIDDILLWFKKEQEKISLNPAVDSNVLLFLIASLLVGSEIIGPHVKEVLNLSEDAFRKLKPKAFQALVTEIQALPGAS